MGCKMDKYSSTFLLVALFCLASTVLSVQEIFVDLQADRGATVEACWYGGATLPCASLDIALRGAQKFNAPGVRILIQPGTYQISEPVTFEWMEQLEMIGMGSDVTLMCQTGAGLTFRFCSNIKIQSIAFKGCGAPQTLFLKTTDYVVSRGLVTHYTIDAWIGLYFIGCSNTQFISVEVSHSNGNGVSFFNTMGENLFKSCLFSSNAGVRTGLQQYPGGGVYIGFYQCMDEPCVNTKEFDFVNNGTEVEIDESATYTFKNCVFEENNATQPDTSQFSRVYHLPGRVQSVLNKGGGLAIFFQEHSHNKSIKVLSCLFRNNIAHWGGGLAAEFNDYSHNNSLIIKSTVFDHNRCPSEVESPIDSQGGGARIAFERYVLEHLDFNTIKIIASNFTGNFAFWGGGISLATTKQEGNNAIDIESCYFEDNIANLGAAMDISILYPTTLLKTSCPDQLKVNIANCNFVRNKATAMATILPTLKVGEGTVYISEVSVAFEGHIVFRKNEGTALVAIRTSITASAQAQFEFIQNSGRTGGALTFYGDAHIELQENTSMSFQENTASESGGAIYIFSVEQHEIAYSLHCFVRYFDPYAHPDQWNASFYFSDNIANQERNSIWVSSILPCVWPSENSTSIADDINHAFCWNGWNYGNGNCTNEVKTSAAQMIVKSPRISAFAGRQRKLPLQLLDDRGQDVTYDTVLIASTQGGNIVVDRSSQYISDASITLYGVLNSTAELHLQTNLPRMYQCTMEVEILPCPPGFDFKLPPDDDYNGTKFQNISKTCDCGGSFGDIVNCNADMFRSTLNNGYCMTYDNLSMNLDVGTCPFIVEYTVGGQIQLPRSISELNEFMCGGLNRDGVLCARCKDGYSLEMQFFSLDCVECTVPIVYSWLIFAAEQLVPTTIFFFIVVIFKINAASAPANAYVYYSQILTIPLAYQALIGFWLISLGESEATYRQTSNFLWLPYTIWNLDFRFLKLHSNLCFSGESNVLYHAALGYVNALFPLVLIAISYVLFELHDRNFRLIVCLWRPFRRCFLHFRTTWNPKNSIIDAFATFIILSYVQFVATSVILLGPGFLWDKLGSIKSVVFHYDASIQYLGREHLPFALLAVFVLATFVAIPPLFLLLYPLKTFQKCMNACNINFLSLRTFSDIFQGCYKDGTKGTRDCRYFAALYFFSRIIVIVIYVVPLYSVRYPLLELIFILQVLLVTLLRPYKDDFYNKLDACISGLLAILDFILAFNYHLSILKGEASGILTTIAYALSFLPLLYMIGFIVKLLYSKGFLASCCKHLRSRRVRLREDETADEISSAPVQRRTECYADCSVPDRVIRPEMYHNLDSDQHEPTLVQNETQASIHEEHQSPVRHYGALVTVSLNSDNHTCELRDLTTEPTD